MKQISSADSGRKSVIGLYGYGRAVTPAGYTAIRDFIHVKAQLGADEFLVAHLHILDDSVISHEILNLERLRNCVFYDRHADIRAVAEYYFERARGNLRVN